MARKTHAEVIADFLKNKSAFSAFIIPKGSVTDNQKRITVIALSDKEARTILQKKYPDHEIHIVHVTTLITDYEPTR